jgi:predicted nucleic-acid-binding protein
VIAVDTNVLLRAIALDDARQTPVALNRLRRETAVFVSKTVLLEMEWVLRSGYDFDRAKMRQVFADLQGLPNLDIEDEAAVRRAVELFGKGLDFADSLHLASAGERRFVTFDRRLQRAARRLALGDISEP